MSRGDEELFAEALESRRQQLPYDLSNDIYSQFRTLAWLACVCLLLFIVLVALGLRIAAAAFLLVGSVSGVASSVFHDRYESQRRVTLRRMLVERLAQLEHEQWTTWSRDLVKRERLSSERLERWTRLWKPYEKLPEDLKDFDREWAKKAVMLMLGDYGSRQEWCILRSIKSLR